MILFMVVGSFCEDYWVEGVFSTRALAEAHVARRYATDASAKRWDELGIRECTLDQPMEDR